MVKDPVASVEVSAETAEGKRLTADIRGVDSFHALWLACSLVLKLLGHFKAAGGKLYAEDGAEFPVEAYLSGLGGKPQ